MPVELIELRETASTNNYLRSYIPTDPQAITLVTAEFQTAGRGQGSNHWESQAGANLLFSLLLCPPTLPATQLFCISEAIALSIREAVAVFTESEDITVKWPNDVYVGDRKIAGILIENELLGQMVSRCIIGCGVNVNQQIFTSDAPNPVSLYQLTGHDTDRRQMLQQMIDGFVQHYNALTTTSPEDQASYITKLREDYLAALYRRKGFHTYRDTKGLFQAEIADVEQTGQLVLRDTQGQCRRYAFKEVEYVLSDSPSA